VTPLDDQFSRQVDCLTHRLPQDDVQLRSGAAVNSPIPDIHIMYSAGDCFPVLLCKSTRFSAVPAETVSVCRSLSAITRILFVQSRSGSDWLVEHSLAQCRPTHCWYPMTGQRLV